MRKRSITCLSLLAVCIACLPLVSCDNESIVPCDNESTAPFPPTSKTNIRLHNISDFDFRDVEVNTFDSPANYGNLGRCQKTEYKAFELAYRYAYVRLFIGDVELNIQPIDFVGETPLGRGYFTYELDVEDPDLRGLTIHTVRDD